MHTMRRCPPPMGAVVALLEGTPHLRVLDVTVPTAPLPATLRPVCTRLESLTLTHASRLCRTPGGLSFPWSVVQLSRAGVTWSSPPVPPCAACSPGLSAVLAACPRLQALRILGSNNLDEASMRALFASPALLPRPPPPPTPTRRGCTKHRRPRRKPARTVRSASTAGAPAVPTAATPVSVSDGRVAGKAGLLPAADTGERTLSVVYLISAPRPLCTRSPPLQQVES